MVGVSPVLKSHLPPHYSPSAVDGAAALCMLTVTVYLFYCAVFSLDFIVS